MSIEISSRLCMDLITNVFYTHYDPSWIASNTDSMDLSKRLSKQREREKQELIDILDNSNSDERYINIQKQKMGLSNWWKAASEKSEIYVNSNEYQQDTEEERLDRMKELYEETQSNVDVLNQAQNNNEIQELSGLPIQPIDEEGE